MSSFFLRRPSHADDRTMLEALDILVCDRLPRQFSGTPEATDAVVEKKNQQRWTILPRPI
jgi:hypothetical protein